MGDPWSKGLLWRHVGRKVQPHGDSWCGSSLRRQLQRVGRGPLTKHRRVDGGSRVF